MLSTPVKVTEDLLPGPATDVASSTISKANSLPLAHNACMAVPTIGSTCAAPGHPGDPHPEGQKMATPWRHINPDPSAEVEGTNMKARNVRKTLILKPNHNSSKIHAVNNLLLRPHIYTQKDFAVKQFRVIH